MISASAIKARLYLSHSELRLTYLVGGFLTLIALIVMTQNYFKYAALGNYSIGLSLAYNLIVYTTYATLTPFIFYLGRARPLREGSWLRMVPLHLGISILLGLFHMMFCNVVLYSTGLASAIVFPRFMSKYLTNVIHFHILAYWAILLLSTYRKPKTRVAGTAKLSRFTVGKNGRTYFVEFDEVLWIEAMDHYQKIHTNNGYHLISQSMKGLESLLPAGQFIRVHRSYFVNVKNVVAMTKGSHPSVELTNGMRIKVGQSYLKQLSDLIKS